MSKKQERDDDEEGYRKNNSCPTCGALCSPEMLNERDECPKCDTSMSNDKKGFPNPGEVRKIKLNPKKDHIKVDFSNLNITLNKMMEEYPRDVVLNNFLTVIKDKFIKNPELRIGQLIMVALKNKDLFNISNTDLIELLKTL